MRVTCDHFFRESVNDLPKRDRADRRVFRNAQPLLFRRSYSSRLCLEDTASRTFATLGLALEMMQGFKSQIIVMISNPCLAVIFLHTNGRLLQALIGLAAEQLLPLCFLDRFVITTKRENGQDLVSLA